MLRRNGPVVKSVESVLRLEGSLRRERFVEEVGGRLWTGKPPWYVISHPGQLSLIPLAGQEMSASQSAVMLCGWGVKACIVHSTCGCTCGWQVKLCDRSPANTCQTWALCGESDSANALCLVYLLTIASAYTTMLITQTVLFIELIFWFHISFTTSDPLGDSRPQAPSYLSWSCRFPELLIQVDASANGQ